MSKSLSVVVALIVVAVLAALVWLFVSGTVQPELLYELGASIKGLTDWIVSVAGAGLVILAIVVFAYWSISNRQNRISIWDFILWNPVTTYRKFCFKGKPYDHDYAFEFEFLEKGENTYNTDGWTVVPTPAITVRGQLTSTWIWHDFYDDAKLTVTLAQDRKQQTTDIHSGWDNCVWDAEYVGCTFKENAVEGSPFLKGNEFCVSESFKPIIVSPRSNERFEIVFIPRNFTKSLAREENSKIAESNVVARDVLPRWQAGVYICKLTMVHRKTMIFRKGRKRSARTLIELHDHDIQRYDKGVRELNDDYVKHYDKDTAKNERDVSFLQDYPILKQNEATYAYLLA